jgi:hypothetical protein
MQQTLRPSALVPRGFVVESAVCDGATTLITVRTPPIYAAVRSPLQTGAVPAGLPGQRLTVSVYDDAINPNGGWSPSPRPLRRSRTSARPHSPLPKARRG